MKEALGNSKLPISVGTGTNSVVGNDLTTNTAISENTTSFGTGNIGGLKGYYWSSINLSAKTITLASAHTGGTAVNCEYAVGDIISIVNDSKFEECSKITAINGSVITVSSFPFTSVATGAGDFSDYCIYCPAKANIGLADLGKCAFIAGSGNKGGNYCSVVAGRDNNVIGQYGVAVGRANKVGYAGFSAGRDNTCTGQYGAVAGGSWNNLTASWAFAAGRANNLNGLYSGSFGRNNSAGVRGYYFTNSGSGNNILLYSDSACTTPANCSYAVGDVLTAGIGARSINKVHITSFTGNKVTLSSKIDLSDYSANQRFIYCEQKSAVGAVAVTSYATAFGLNCKALGENSVAAGRNCVVPSTGGVAIGVDNRAGYSSFVGGGDNQTDKEYCVLLGNGNRVTDNQSYAIGQGLKINYAHQFVVGRYNEQLGNSIAFIVGAGTSDINRKNAMWLTQSGNLVLAGSKLTFNGNDSPTAFTADDLTNTANTATAAKNAVETIKKTYLPLSGGTITNDTTIMGSTGQYGIKFTNGDIQFLSDGGATVGGTITGISSSKGTSTTRAMSEKGVADNYVAKTDISNTTGTDTTKVPSLKCLNDNYVRLDPGNDSQYIYGSLYADNLMMENPDNGSTAVEISSTSAAIFNQGISTTQIELTDDNTTITGISDTKGASSTVAASQKCLVDNYLAKSDVTYSTTDLTAGTSPLATGSFYFVYE